MKELTSIQDFFEINSTRKVLFIVTPRCELSKLMEPSLIDFCEKKGISITKWDASKDLRQINPFKVQVVPTIIVFVDNQPIKTITGYHSYKSLERELL